MMRVLECSSSRLRLSNTDLPWTKWIFVGAIVIGLLAAIGVSGWVLRPARWSGVLIGCLLLFVFIRGLPRSFDSEFF